MKHQHAAVCAVLFVLLFSCQTYNKNVTLENAAQKAAADISDKILKGNIAVINVSAQNRNLELQIIRWLENSLLANNHLEVVSRQQIDTVLQEQKLGASGIVDDASAQEIGHILGAAYVLSGELAKIGDRYILNLQLLEVETARLFYSNSFNIKELNEKPKPLRF